MLLNETDRKLGLTQAAASCIPNPRSALLITHAVRDMPRQRVYGQALGWEDLNDHRDLRLDVAIRTAVGGEHGVASAPTLCRLESWSDRRTAVDLHKVLVEQCIASFKTSPEELVLDFDATDNPLRMLLAALAYVLIERMPAMALQGPALATAQVDTLRIKLLKVAAAITRNTRRVCMHLASRWPSADIFAHAMRELRSP